MERVVSILIRLTLTCRNANAEMKLVLSFDTRHLCIVLDLPTSEEWVLRPHLTMSLSKIIRLLEFMKKLKALEFVEVLFRYPGGLNNFSIPGPYAQQRQEIYAATTVLETALAHRSDFPSLKMSSITPDEFYRSWKMWNEESKSFEDFTGPLALDSNGAWRYWYAEILKHERRASILARMWQEKRRRALLVLHEDGGS